MGVLEQHQINFNSFIKTNAFKILTFNTKGQQRMNKRKAQLLFLKRQKGSIIALQETHLVCENEYIYKQQWQGKCVFSHGTTSARGVAILFAQHLDVEIIEHKSDTEGRWIWVKAKVQGQRCSIMNLYAPNEEKEQIKFYNRVLSFLHQNYDPVWPLMVLGDFNVVRNPVVDKIGGRTSTRTKVNQIIDTLLQSFALVDIFRVLHPWKKSFTWSQKTPLIRCRLDHIFIPSDWVPVAQKALTVHAMISDHHPVVLYLEGMAYQKRGPGFWKLNTTLLENTELCTTVSDIIQQSMQESNQDPNRHPKIIWYKIKDMVTAEFKAYGRQKAYLQKMAEKQLLSQIADFESNPLSLEGDTLQEYLKCKDSLNALYEYKAKGCLIRSKVQWAHSGERSTKYFLGLEKRNYVQTNLVQLEKDDGSIVTQPMEILQIAADFYQKLYQERQVDWDDPEIKLIEEAFLNEDDLPILSNSQRETLERPLSYFEIKQTIFSFANGKSPGIDGLPIEFYKKFWEDIKDILFETLESELYNGREPTFKNRGLIKLLPKPFKNLLSVKNWRPITLLNVDYKILSKLLAQRVSAVLPSLISYDQIGCMKGRYIGQHIRQLWDVMIQTKRQHIPGFVISLDVEKAHDSTNWSFMDKILAKFGFGKVFRQWIQNMVVDTMCTVATNGYHAPWFPVERGWRQGDPLAPPLFLLAMEILAIQIRKCPDLKGVEINGFEHKLIQFSDDTTLLVDGENSAKALFEILDRFGKISGLYVNKDKTEIIGLGANATLSTSMLGIPVKPKPIKLLGIWFTYDIREFRQRNILDKIDKLRNIL